MMTQLSAFDSTRQFGGSASSGVAGPASWLFARARQPDVLVVLALCAIGLVLTLVAAATLPGFTTTLAEASAVVGP